MKSLNKFGYTKMEVLVVAVLLGIVAFITINSTSYAFAIDTTDSVKEVKALIEKQAEEYALDNLDLFKEADTNYILVSDLVDNGYMMTNSDGMVTSPDNSGKTFNDNKVKVEYNKESNKVEATFID
jgi:Tfp pilus assembly protein PilE